MIRIYGIPNCDTMKKAFTWLKAHEIEYQFHNFKKEGLDASLLDGWIARVGWEPLLNRRGMMWRKLDDDIKANIDLNSARTIMLETPSIIKRPLLDNGDELNLGFTEERYRALFQSV
jgi:arsenate reductase (glutaredoxin)